MYCMRFVRSKLVDKVVCVGAGWDGDIDFKL